MTIKNMKKIFLFCLYIYGMFLGLPLLMTILLGGVSVVGGHQTVGERYLPLLLSTEISEEVPEEVLKAQAVLIRTNYIVARSRETWKEQLYPKLLNYYMDGGNLWGKMEHYEKYRNAVLQTGQIMTVDNNPCWVPYHQISNGKTRDGEETLHDETYAYLTSVDSAWDRQAEEYAETIQYPEDFARNLEIIANDSAGYVAEVRVGTELLSGEELRRQLGLPSSAFSLQKTGELLQILCMGKGHGLGMSQYGAGVLADEGRTYIEILNYYFPMMEISQVQVTE